MPSSAGWSCTPRLSFDFRGACEKCLTMNSGCTVRARAHRKDRSRIWCYFWHYLSTYNFIMLHVQIIERAHRLLSFYNRSEDFALAWLLHKSLARRVSRFVLLFQFLLFLIRSCSRISSPIKLHCRYTSNYCSIYACVSEDSYTIPDSHSIGQPTIKWNDEPKQFHDWKWTNVNRIDRYVIFFSSAVSFCFECNALCLHSSRRSLAIFRAKLKTISKHCSQCQLKYSLNNSEKIPS